MSLRSQAQCSILDSTQRRDRTFDLLHRTSWFGPGAAWWSRAHLLFHRLRFSRRYRLLLGARRFLLLLYFITVGACFLRMLHCAHFHSETPTNRVGLGFCVFVTRERLLIPLRSQFCQEIHIFRLCLSGENDSHCTYSVDSPSYDFHEFHFADPTKSRAPGFSILISPIVACL